MVIIPSNKPPYLAAADPRYTEEEHAAFDAMKGATHLNRYLAKWRDYNEAPCVREMIYKHNHTLPGSEEEKRGRVCIEFANATPCSVCQESKFTIY